MLDYEYPMEITKHRDHRVTQLMEEYEEQGMNLDLAEKEAEREYDKRFAEGAYDGEYVD